MANIFSEDDIDFALYENETDAQQKVRPASMWVQELIDQIKNPSRPVHKLMPWQKTHNLIQFRPGEVTVWGGANGNGKSLVTGMVALSLCSQDEKVAIASFEMKPIKTLERMGRQFSGENPKHPAYASGDAVDHLVSIYEQFRDWTKDRLWLYDQQGTVDAKQVCAVTRYAAKELGATQIFIDSLMKCVDGEDDHNGQKQFVNELTSIARDHNIHIHLIHHVKKPPNEDHKPGKYDFKGTGAVTDQVDNVIAVWRNKAKERRRDEGKLTADADANEPDQLLICDKQRNGEWEGTIGLWFDPNSQQYLGSRHEPPLDIYAGPEKY